MARMTGGQALVKSLRNNGIDTIFGLPGVQMDATFNALYDEGNAIRVIHSRHEQGAAYMAFGYAHATGRVGAYTVVPGPGLLNTTAALATAYGCNTRVLAVIPRSRDIIAAERRMSTVVEHSPESEVTAVFEQLAETILDIDPADVELPTPMSDTELYRFIRT